jgi:hypothetical protein
VSAAAIALLAEVIAGQERILERIEKLERTFVDEQLRVKPIATLLEQGRDEAQGLTVVGGAKR